MLNLDRPRHIHILGGHTQGIAQGLALALMQKSAGKIALIGHPDQLEPVDFRPPSPSPDRAIDIAALDLLLSKDTELNTGLELKPMCQFIYRIFPRQIDPVAVINPMKTHGYYRQFEKNNKRQHYKK